MSTCTDNWEQVEAASKMVLGERIVAYIEQARAKPHPESQLIAVLHRCKPSSATWPRRISTRWPN